MWTTLQTRPAHQMKTISKDYAICTPKFVLEVTRHWTWSNLWPEPRNVFPGEAVQRRLV